jgi:hypothetical protein
MRAYLRDIFEEAVEQDFLIKDPAARLRVPTQLRETDKTTLTWEQLRAALESVDAEDRVLLELDMTDALRPSELFPLRWKCFDPDTSSIELQETVYRGKLRNFGKTKKSLGKIHISSLMVSDLLAWKVICPDSSPEAFIFPNRDGGVRDPNNYRKRVLGELRKKLNLPKLAFSDNPENDGHPQPDQGNGQRYPGRDASRTTSNDRGCLHASDSRGRQADDRLDARRTPQWPGKTNHQLSRSNSAEPVCPQNGSTINTN